MNKKFCIQCLVKLSLSVSTCVLYHGIALADLSSDSENEFLFSIDEKNSEDGNKKITYAEEKNELLYYPGALKNSFFEVDEPESPENRKQQLEAGLRPYSMQTAQVEPTPAATPALPTANPAAPAATTAPAAAPAAPAAATPAAAPAATAPAATAPAAATPAPAAPPAPPAPTSPTVPAEGRGPAVAPQIPLPATPAPIPVAAPAGPGPGNGPGGVSGTIPNIENLDQKEEPLAPLQAPEETPESQKTILINFNNVSIIEYIRFISRISNKNFIFDENELQFNVTIVSEEPTTIENIMAALLQELRIHGLTLMEQGNNVIIHKNPKVNNISKVVDEETSLNTPIQAEIITQVFRLNTVEVEKAAAIIRPLVSDTSIVEVVSNTNHLIITDLAANIRQIAALLRSIDSPKSGLVIGQYVVKQGIPDALIDLTQRIMQPIALDQPLTMLSHAATNSIFIVSTPYLVERTLSIMQYLDQSQGTTQILNLKGMRFQHPEGGQWELDENGNWKFRTGDKGDKPPEGNWSLDQNGNWIFTPGKYAGGKGPEGQWVKDANGNWVFQLAPGKQIAPEKVSRREQLATNLPIGHIERTKFLIYKLHYRQAELIEQALRRIGESLKQTNINADLVAAIDSIQSIEATNALIFTGTPSAIQKLKELIEEIDRPLRQVFLELLILEVDLNDSITFGVNWGSRFGGGSSAGSQAFLSAGSPLTASLDTTVAPSLPNASGLARVPGFNLGVLGQHLTHNGVYFNSIGALVSALHSIDSTNIVLNPKILTEDNSPAEIFVGLNTQFPTQAIANNNGNILTQNFEYRDIGTRFKVTPLIGEGDMITLDIEEEKTAIIPNPNPNITPAQQQNIVVGPSVSKSRTTTRVHMPNGYFLILSGSLEDQIVYHRDEIPCLGGIPVIGAAFSNRIRQTEKTNLMLFIRPLIVDTYEEMQNVTRHQQEQWRNKNSLMRTWKYDAKEALDYFNIRDDLWPQYDTGQCECEYQESP